MAYLDDLLKGSTKAINNFDSLGVYSPLYGFSNEDELAKNPYQQILSSAPKEQTYNLSNPLNSGWLENRNMFNSNGNSFQIPDGINIDSTFYNRKDIYDLKQRLEASGIDIPNTKKDKPGIITRALDILSIPASFFCSPTIRSTRSEPSLYLLLSDVKPPTIPSNKPFNAFVSLLLSNAL